MRGALLWGTWRKSTPRLIGRTVAIFALLLIGQLALCSAVEAQGRGSLRAKFDQKMKKPFVSKVPWALSLEEARKRAAEQKKPILGYFTRSYSP